MAAGNLLLAFGPFEYCAVGPVRSYLRPNVFISLFAARLDHLFRAYDIDKGFEICVVSKYIDLGCALLLLSPRIERASHGSR